MDIWRSAKLLVDQHGADAPIRGAQRADWTRADPVITAYLQSFGRYGVPLDVAYGPGAP